MEILKSSTSIVELVLFYLCVKFNMVIIVALNILPTFEIFVLSSKIVIEREEIVRLFTQGTKIKRNLKITYFDEIWVVYGKDSLIWVCTMWENETFSAMQIFFRQINFFNEKVVFTKFLQQKREILSHTFLTKISWK